MGKKFLRQILYQWQTLGGAFKIFRGSMPTSPPPPPIFHKVSATVLYPHLMNAKWKKIHTICKEILLTLTQLGYEAIL